MSKPLIRAARREDCGRISDIYNHYVLHDTCTYQIEPETLDERLRWFEAHDCEHPVFVAEDDDGVVAWGSLSVFNRREGYRFTVEDSIYLAPDRRGRGLGKALLGLLVRTAGALGYHSIIAGISADQPASLAVHSKLGFVPVGRVNEVGYKFDRWLDVITMQHVVDPNAHTIERSRSATDR